MHCSISPRKKVWCIYTGASSSLHVFPPHSMKGDVVEIPRGLIVSEDKDVQVKKATATDSNFLLPQ